MKWPPKEGYVGRGKVWTKRDIKELYKNAAVLAKDLGLALKRPTQRCLKCGRKEFGWCECE